MPQCHPSLPKIWLVSDARNDAVLERVLARLPRGSGFIFRHYHLAPAERKRRFRALASLARRRGHLAILSGTAQEARAWRADGIYRAAGLRRPSRQGDGRGRCDLARGLRLLTAHSLGEIAAARRARADAIVLSPVFPTRSHPDARPLGPLRFRLLAARAGLPVIALGGMDLRRARRLRHAQWAAIDGICDHSTRRIPLDC